MVRAAHESRQVHSDASFSSILAKNLANSGYQLWLPSAVPSAATEPFRRKSCFSLPPAA